MINNKFSEMTKILFLIPIIWILTIALTVTECYSDDLSFEVTVDGNRVALGSSIKLNLTFYGSQNVPAPHLPPIEGFKSQYLGPQTEISVVNGSVSTSITHVYSLLASETGSFTIPSFSVEYKGQTFTSKPILVEIVQEDAARRSPGASGNTSNLEDRIFLILHIDKKEAYVNDVISVKVRLYMDNISVRDIQYPEIDFRSLQSEGFKEPKRSQEVLNGVMYDVIEFETDIFAVHPGEFILGPAELTCNLVTRKKSRQSFFDDDFFDGFFDRYEKYPLRLQSLEVPLTVLDLPSEGRPKGFNGAVGNYKFYLEANPKEVKVGDPITLKMRILGEGNFKTLSPPSPDFSEDEFKIYEPEVQQGKGVKEFEQVLIPKKESVTEIPQISFHYFDTDKRAYKTIVAGPIPIKVNPLAEGEELKVFELPESRDAFRKGEKLGRDIIFIKDNTEKLRRRGSYLYRSKPFIFIQVVPMALIILVSIYQKRKERLETDVRYARRMRAPRKAKKNLAHTKELLGSADKDSRGVFFDAVFKTLQEYLGDKFHLTSGGITADVVKDLAKFDVNSGTLDKLKECFENCDRARYAPKEITQTDMRSTYRLLEEVIDEMERAKL
ncbi:MAG: protein BatD [Candidatus Omnitrophica bacterium]|nr:protein BatD [Candidatus Omnitrophota bacterium]